MRNFTSDDLDRFFGLERTVLWRVRVQNSSGVMVEYTVAGGSTIDWVEEVAISGNIDQMAVTATISLFRETDAQTLAPYMAPGAEALKAGRAVEIMVAILDLGGSPGDEDWWLLFDGHVDDVSWGGFESRVVLSCRDLSGVLLDAWTIAENTYGNNAVPTPIEQVMQALLDEVLEDDAPTLDVIGDPDFGIIEYEQQMQSLADALKALSDLIGWDLRYVWSDAYGEFRLTFQEPDRDKEHPDTTISPADYYEIPEFGESSTDIRNFGVIKWGGGKVTAQDDVSIAEYGRKRYIVLDATQDAQLNTEAKVTALITAVVSDLSQPLATQSAVLPLFPVVDLNDFYEFEANGVQYSEAQTMAVVGFEHRLSAEGSSTTLHLRGSPTGGVTRWTALRNRLEGTIPEEEEEELTVEDIEFYFTTPYGSIGFDLEGERDTSLGGFVSTTEIGINLNNLFRAVTDEERGNGVTLYRSFAVLNNNASPVPRDWECVRGWLSFQGEHGVTWGLALDPQGVHTKEDLFSLISVDEFTPPSPSLVYVDPVDFDDPEVLMIGTVPAGSGFIVHVRLEVSSGATGQITDESVVFRNEVPATVESS